MGYSILVSRCRVIYWGYELVTDIIIKKSYDYNLYYSMVVIV